MRFKPSRPLREQYPGRHVADGNDFDTATNVPVKPEERIKDAVAELAELLDLATTPEPAPRRRPRRGRATPDSNS